VRELREAVALVGADLKVVLQGQARASDALAAEQVAHVQAQGAKEVEAATGKRLLAEKEAERLKERLERAGAERELAQSEKERAEVALEKLRGEVDSVVASEKADAEEQMRRWKREAEVAAEERDKAAKDAAAKVKQMEVEVARQREEYEAAGAAANEAAVEGLREVMQSFAGKIAAHLEVEAGLGGGGGGGGLSEEDLAALRGDVAVAREDLHARSDVLEEQVAAPRSPPLPSPLRNSCRILVGSLKRFGRTS
jgi:hypothetical protein